MRNQAERAPTQQPLPAAMAHYTSGRSAQGAVPDPLPCTWSTPPPTGGTPPSAGRTTQRGTAAPARGPCPRRGHHARHAHVHSQAHPFRHYSRHWRPPPPRRPQPPPSPPIRRTPAAAPRPSSVTTRRGPTKRPAPRRAEFGQGQPPRNVGQEVHGKVPKRAGGEKGVQL